MGNNKIPLRDAPTKPVELSGYWGEHGHSTIVVKCPWCGHRTRAFIWSLSGSGKRCENPDCRALLTPTVAFLDRQAEKLSQQVKTPNAIGRSTQGEKR